jgi:hypothetical protein
VINFIREFFSQPDANWKANQEFIKHIREKYMSFVEEETKTITLENGSEFEVVAFFNNDYSKIVADDSCYLIVNGNRVTQHIFDKAIEVIKVLPKPQDLKRNRDAKLTRTLRFIEQNIN